MLSKLTLCLSLVGALSSTSVNAAPGEGRGKPPQEAFEICKDKAEGDSVEIETPRGDTIEAVCQPMDDTLVAVPADRPKPRT